MTLKHLLLAGMGFLILIFLVMNTWIGVSVRQRCLLAQKQYEGSCVEALEQVVAADYNSFDERNRAIWALGQLGDEAALATLNSLYTGQIPDREPYPDALSQYELQKAIKLIESGFNLNHLVWRPEKLIK